VQKPNQVRERIAKEAARLMCEAGISDFQLAKRKALQRLRIPEHRGLPSNEEIEAAVSEYQRLFRADSQPQRLARLRQVAVRAMRFLERFQPRLVGAVLSGTADEHSNVCLHLFAETSEEVGLFLMDNGVPHEHGERTMKLASDDSERLPTCRFLADDVPVELVIFAERVRRRVPLSPVDGRPMERAALSAVEALPGEPAPWSVPPCRRWRRCPASRRDLRHVLLAATACDRYPGSTFQVRQHTAPLPGAGGGAVAVASAFRLSPARHGQHAPAAPWVAGARALWARRAGGDGHRPHGSHRRAAATPQAHFRGNRCRATARW